MSTRIRRVRSTLLAALFVLAGFDSLAESPDRFERAERPKSPFLDEAPVYSGMGLSVVVFRDVGWTEPEVSQILQETSRIYARECRFSLNFTGIRFIEVDERLHDLDDYLQERLLAELPDIERPVAFFMGRTSGDQTAYAYLQGTASPSQGTAWISRQVAAPCRAQLLAHEIGHVALAADRHSREPGNLMGESCSFTNFGNQSTGTDLNRQQCQTLWRRYAPREDKL
jgi:hypothetical protein